jgi:radical SAM-linked protein
MSERPGVNERPAGRARVRIRFSKVGKIRWTSHRDVARMWERAFRRVGLPLAYSEGFSPRPRVSFGLALPTGHESVAEYLDVELSEISIVDIPGLPARLSDALPEGVGATAAEVVAPGTLSLQEDVASCTWVWVVAPGEGSEPIGPEQMEARVAFVLAAPSVIVARSRKGGLQAEEIRPGILNLRVVGPAGSDPSLGMWLEADLACRPRLLRPADVVAALGSGLEERSVRRTHQWILREGARREPLEGAGPDIATEAPHAWERAS